jgi:hypothetical protein
LFFNFAELFDFGCYSLSLEMSFMDYYLPYFRQQLITCPPSALLTFQSLFTESSRRDQLLALPPFSDALTASYPLFAPSAECLFSVPCLLFSFVSFWGDRGQFSQGAMLLYPIGGCGNTT